MLYTSYFLSLSNQFPLCTSLIFLLRTKMPKYAVAVGRQVGIYDTYNECKKQILNYPNARFKKFDSEKEAAEFIAKWSIQTDSSLSTSGSTFQQSKENVFKPDLIKVEKISPSNVTLNSLNNRFTLIEEKLNAFIASTTSMFETLTTKLKTIEGSLKRKVETDPPCDESPKKKPKIENKITVHDFLVDEEGYAIAFTDGACSRNGKMGAMAGIGVWFNDDHLLNVSEPVKGPATNNNAEIQAARIAICQANKAGIRKLCVHTDSKFVINCITDWINKWKKNNWQLSTGGPVKNKTEIVKLDEAVQKMVAVKWTYVAGHQGIHGNEMADKLAKEGAARYRKDITYSLESDSD